MNKFSLCAAAVLALAIAGCAENQTRIGEGAGLGGILGAAAGGIIGHQSGNDAAGILVGGAAGAATGAIVGSQIDKPHRVETPPPVSGSQTAPVTMQQVVDLTKQGVSSDEIIGRIRGSNSKYYLTADDVTYLRGQGVSQRVIEVMQQH